MTTRLSEIRSCAVDCYAELFGAEHCNLECHKELLEGLLGYDKQLFLLQPESVF